MSNFELNHYELIESYIPFDLSQPKNFLLAFFIVYFFIIARYFAMVGATYWVYWKSDFFKHRLIYKKMPNFQFIRNEIFWSCVTSLIFALGGVFTGILWQKGLTRFYLKFDEYPLWYMPLSLAMMMLIHEVYFYFSHRLMHHPLLYRRIHKTHHASLYPSPWASFSFHPWESVIESMILPLIVMIVPVHPLVFIFYMTLMTVSAIVNHLGFEVLPLGSGRAWWARLLITATHHSEHHFYFNCNYGLYFTFLDRWLGTESPNYSEDLIANTNKISHLSTKKI